MSEALDGRIPFGERGLIIARRSGAFDFRRSLLKVALAESRHKLAQRFRVGGLLPLEQSELPGPAEEHAQ
jgi:hypothetical protein